jgi:uncharacterized alpha-E superfamily protein
MLSRIADSLYWLDRYMERTDGILRILRTEYVLSLDKGPENVTSWRPILEIFSHADEEKIDEIEFNSTLVLQYLFADVSNNNSLRVLLNKARENARGAQDHITKEVWEQVNHMYHSVNSPSLSLRLSAHEALPSLDRMTEMITLYKGVAGSTMPRSMGWNFMNIGKYMERCLITLEMTNLYFRNIDYNLDDTRDILYWRNLLLSLSGYELHLKTYRSNKHTMNVLEQVLFNREFTRSVHYSIDKINHYLKDVIRKNNPPQKERLSKEFGRLMSLIEFADTEQVKSVSPEKFLDLIRSQLLQFNKLLTQVFFSYS